MDVNDKGSIVDVVLKGNTFQLINGIEYYTGEDFVSMSDFDWDVVWRDPKGAKFIERFDTKDEAIQYLSDSENNIESNLITATGIKATGVYNPDKIALGYISAYFTKDQAVKIFEEVADQLDDMVWLYHENNEWDSCFTYSLSISEAEKPCNVCNIVMPDGTVQPMYPIHGFYIEWRVI